MLNEVGAVWCPAAADWVAAGAWDGSSGSGGLPLTSLGGSWTLKEAPEPAGAAGVCCPVGMLCVVAGFHAGTKIFERGLILTRTG